MPSKFTENYNLSQWEPGDAVLHTDFNADNAAIDAALSALDAGKLGKIEIFKSISMEEPSSGNLFAPSQGKWNQWAITGNICFFDETEESKNAQLQIYNNDAKKEIAVVKAAPFILLYFPMHDEETNITGLFIGKETFLFQQDFPFKNFSIGSISILNNVKVPRFRIYNLGIR